MALADPIRMNGVRFPNFDWARSDNAPNTGKSRIQFGAGNQVAPGKTIELDDATIKLRSQAIDNLIESGDLIEGVAFKAPKEPEKKAAEKKAEAEKKAAEKK